MLYRILTQDTPEYRANVLRLADLHFPCYSVFYGEGRWNGESEKSITVEVCNTDEIGAHVASFARLVCRTNRQEAVLVQEFAVESTLVTEPLGMSREAKARDTEESDREYILAQQRKRGWR